MSIVQQAVEAGAPPHVVHEQAGSEPSDDHGPTQMIGRSSGVPGGPTQLNLASPASVAARIKRRTPPPPAADPGTSSGSAPMGGRTPARDFWGDGMINEADRGSAHDH